MNASTTRPRGSGQGRLLFLCTGNYYRSRFAEELWRHLELAEPSGWRAESRGLLVARGLGNIGPISSNARRALDELGVSLSEPVRSPLQLEADDLALSGHIVAMSESEHRTMVRRLFPQWVDAVEYWDVEDVDLCPVEVALANLSSRVRDLRGRLCGAGPLPRRSS